MSSNRNALFSAPPFPVEEALNRLGENLRTARLRRNMTLKEVAGKIGVSRYVVSDAEKGKPSSGVGIYVAMLWAYGLLDHLATVADPALDIDGLALSLAHERQRASNPEALDNDF